MSIPEILPVYPIFVQPNIEALHFMTEEINKAIEILTIGGLILYPTDTVWSIGCDATNEVAVQKIRHLKQQQESEALICMVAHDGMLERYISKVPDLAYDIMDLSTKPTTIIYDQPRGVAKNLIAADNTLAIRVASDKFCQYLINKFKKPLVSATANITGEPTPQNFQQVSQTVLNGVDYVIQLYQNIQKINHSAIIKLGNDGTVKVIRA